MTLTVKGGGTVVPEVSAERPHRVHTGALPGAMEFFWCGLVCGDDDDDGIAHVCFLC
jgi:hypothetical protein